MKRTKVMVLKKHRHSRDIRKVGEIYEDYLPQDVTELCRRGVLMVLSDAAPRDIYKVLIEEPVEEITKPEASKKPAGATKPKRKRGRPKKK